MESFSRNTKCKAVLIRHKFQKPGLFTASLLHKAFSHYIFIRMACVDLCQRATSAADPAGPAELRSRAKLVSYGVPERGEGCGCAIEQWREKSQSQNLWKQATGRLHVARVPLLPSKTSNRLHASAPHSPSHLKKHRNVFVLWSISWPLEVF